MLFRKAQGASPRQSSDMLASSLGRNVRDIALFQSAITVPAMAAKQGSVSERTFVE